MSGQVTAQTNGRSAELKEIIKRILKEQSYTYSDLAQVLSCSVPTVKRVLGPEEISLERLLTICDFLKVSLSDLEKMSQIQKQNSRTFFTPEQEEFLAAHPNYLSYFSNLYNGETPESMQQKFRLTKRSNELYLIRLEKHDLLRVDAKGRVRLTYADFPRLMPHGKLIRAQFKTIIAKSSQFFTRQITRQLDEAEKRTSISLMLNYTTKEFEAQFYAKLNALVEEARNHSVLLEKLPSKVETRRLVINTMVSVLDLNDPDIRMVEDLLGEVTNL